MFGIGKSKQPKLDYDLSHWKVVNPISHREDYDGPSTCIAKAEYDGDNDNLKVQFRGSSKEYDYPATSEEVKKFRDEADGRSWGRTFNRLFRGK